MTFEKLFNEIYAVVSLRYFWEGFDGVFVKNESPDWINPQLDMGLEVSQALRQNDGEAKKFIELYLGRPKSEIPATFTEKYAGRLYFYNDRLWGILPEDEIKGEYVSKALYRFECKLEKLGTNYARFRHNALYLFLHTDQETPEGIENILLGFDYIQNRGKTRFDMVFLGCSRALYVLDMNESTVKQILVPEDAVNFMNDETEKLRSFYQWENGAQFPREA